MSYAEFLNFASKVDADLILLDQFTKKELNKIIQDINGYLFKSILNDTSCEWIFIVKDKLKIRILSTERIDIEIIYKEEKKFTIPTNFRSINSVARKKGCTCDINIST